ncbi:tryptophan synthase subunit alpha [Lacticaseibacillus pabuli]|uniref:Tryptophan synthase alpha chain n=1 Tax=Lacticaseibacillus pabuli TaxID=3025672 RepID=A0ABY7WY99_9LACO|nr:tryptophan synthase subunit alpha [Lacticaseibacillus sp. KACC 23028]WDF82900.1 tryptophan synthase subunit alpha [Lacticaseibacillus sp. KACC 23028]
MSKISAAFADHKAFIPFIVSGDPTPEATLQNIKALADGGADIIELGIPFSDPVADGPVIQKGDLRAFADGISVAGVFDIVAKAREFTDIPMAFLTYANIPFQYGYDAFCKRCAELGVTGLVIPDLPYEEQGEIRPSAEKYGIDIIELITLTSGKDRVKQIASVAQGFIYVVSSEGVTGTRDEFDSRLTQLLSDIHAVTDVPAAIGFGIHTPDQAQAMAKIADGVIVGSGIVQIVGDKGTDAPAAVEQYVSELAAATH